MPRYLILAQSEVTAHALNAWRELLGWSEDDVCPIPIVHAPQNYSAEAGTIAYSLLAERIERSAKGDAKAMPLNDVVVMVDSIRPLQMSAVADGSSWENLIALLVLTFPEIKWIFGVIGKHDGIEESPVPASIFPEADHNLISLLTQPRRDPLFDPSALREWVRYRTNVALDRLSIRKDNHTQQAPFRLASRRWVAAAIDEEIDYALMHGHAAYRYGFRADVVTTWALMEARFAAKEKSSHGYELLLEDMRLVFPDKPATIHLSGLKNDRASNCPLLADAIDSSRWRFLITTGQQRDGTALIAENEEVLYNKHKGTGKILFKPVGGFAELWSNAGLYEDLWDGNRPGNAQGFAWPPAQCREDLYDGHGSPGKLALIATALIRRATELLKSADSPADFVRCAVLAIDAAEYLGGKTPTLTLAALSIKHESEVRAECMFIGAGYHLSLNKRIEELYGEIGCVTHWFHRDVRFKSSLDAKAAILNRLILSFREAGQMEEEHTCLVEIRRVNRRMSRPRGWKAINPLAWAAHAVLAYSEWLMGSFDRILFVILCYTAAFVGLAYVGYGLSKEPNNELAPFAKTMAWIFGGSTEDKAHHLSLLSSVAAVFGAFHVGVIISYLYSLIARK